VRKRIYTLALSVVWLGALRAIGTLMLDRHWAAGLGRLTFGAVEDAALDPSMWAWSALAAVAALAGAALTDRLVTPWIRSPERRDAVAGITLISIFWLVLVIFETLERTSGRDVITSRFDLTQAHGFILAAAFVGACASFGALRCLARMRGGRAGMATVAILLGWFLLAKGVGAAGRRPDPGAETPKPNVLLISIDTLRADHLSAYGYPRKTSPRIDSIAASGILYENAIAQAPNTHPSTAAIVTSRYPSELGGNPFKYIPYSTATLAEVFRNAGYRTSAVVSNVWLRTSMGFDQGFEGFDDKSAMSEFYADGERVAWKNAADVSDAALSWLESRPEGPFFLWVHYLDPHHPYEPPPEYREAFSTSYSENAEFLRSLAMKPTGEQTRTLTYMGRGKIPVTDEQFASIVDQYDGEIAYTDSQIGRLLDFLESRSLADNTIIAVTADHGEEFRDHGGWGHSHTLHRELLHVPLIVAYPGAPAGTRVEATTRLIDLAPTLLARAGLPVPTSMRGTDLSAAIADRPAVSMLTRKDEISVEFGNHKLVSDLARTRPRLYELGTDPEERIDRASSDPKLVEALYAIIDREVGGKVEVEQTHDTASQLDDSTRKQLEALGYLD
jgi:arylsulfatase A-like enzyme